MARRLPAFICSLPRSGTTLLSVMLNNHPDIYCPPEPWIMFALEALGSTHAAHPADAGLIGAAFQAFLTPAERVAPVRNLALDLYAAKLRGTGKKLLIDKTPRYFLIAPFIRTLFPTAKLLVLVRNPFDVAASYKNSWGINLPAEIKRQADTAHALDLVLGVERVARLAAEKHRCTYVLRYEDLVADAAGQLRAILEFLGLEYHEGLERFSLRNGEHQSSYFGDRKVLQTNAPHETSLGSWKTAFDRNELNVLLDAVGAETMRFLGYAETLGELFDRDVVDSGQAYCEYKRSVYELHLAARRVTMAGDGLFEATPPR